MKHLAKIQTEFVKIARLWDELSLDEQKAYLQRHPLSKRRLTAKPGAEQAQSEQKEGPGKLFTEGELRDKVDKTTTKRKIKELTSGIYDRARHNKEDDSYTFKRSFFYRHGMTAEKFANAIKDAANKLGLDAEIVNFQEKWHSWPKNSWFEAKLKFKEKEEKPTETSVETKPVEENIDQKREELEKPKLTSFPDYEIPKGDYKLKKDMDVWVFSGTAPTNAYYGNSQIYAPKYVKVKAPAGSKVTLNNYSEQYVTLDGKGTVKVKFAQPEEKGAFEKSYGGNYVQLPMDNLEKVS